MRYPPLAVIRPFAPGRSRSRSAMVAMEWVT
ncbi:Uncharacterised protein [Mycobacteroides abscessus subsp. abscessus]|nr:Uncharacterised protein [Mycobacteroides abscessus subsp. abscessus]